MLPATYAMVLMHFDEKSVYVVVVVPGCAGKRCWTGSRRFCRVDHVDVDVLFGKNVEQVVVVQWDSRVLNDS